jgi:hypothetical protein
MLRMSLWEVYMMRKMIVAALLATISALPAQAVTTYRYDFDYGTGYSWYWDLDQGGVLTPGWFSATMRLSVLDDGHVICSMPQGGLNCGLSESGLTVEYEWYETFFTFEALFDPVVGQLPTSSDRLISATLAGHDPNFTYWSEFRHVRVSVFQEEAPHDAFQFDFNAGIPEPATWAMMIGGFALAGGALRRRRGMAAHVQRVQFA